MWKGLLCKMCKLTNFLSTLLKMTKNARKTLKFANNWYENWPWVFARFLVFMGTVYLYSTPSTKNLVKILLCLFILRNQKKIPSAVEPILRLNKSFTQTIRVFPTDHICKKKSTKQ